MTPATPPACAPVTGGTPEELNPAHIKTTHRLINNWFIANARDLPWRREDCSAWGVMVSEFMLQQTPVKRVLPVWDTWMRRWPTPVALAAEPAAEAVRAWGRLGYPRRAQRLHAAAVAIVEHHGGAVPGDYEELIALPGVGSYTAAAITSFAFGRRACVIDTNIRRVHARIFSGKALPRPALNSAERRLAEALLPEQAGASCLWNAAAMELGALICTAKNPNCPACPVRHLCAWVSAGKPQADYVPTGQSWHGTDRQLRGAMMAVLRAAHQPIPKALLINLHPTATVHGTPPDAGMAQALAALRKLEPAPEQVQRCYSGLLADELARESGGFVSL